MYGAKESEKLVESLNNSAAHRNWLAHRYFKQNFQGLDSPEERRKMIEKLAGVTIELTELAQYLQEWSSFVAKTLSAPGEYEARVKAAGL